jgi:hypothetical protein
VTRHRLGDWTCPSGNNVVAYYRPIDGGGHAMIDMEWDDAPPLLPDDQRFYLVVIRPALLARVRAYTESIGAALVIDL